MSIFDQARAAVSVALVEHLTTSPGAYWQGGEYWTRNPLRADQDIGSFSITEQGLWHDFIGESGDLISLVVAMRGCTKKQADAEIIRLAGGSVDEDPARRTKTKPDKPRPQVPAPDSALKQLNSVTCAAWVIERHGKPVKGWTYRTADGGVAFLRRHLVQSQGDDGHIIAAVEVLAQPRGIAEHILKVSDSSFCSDCSLAALSYIDSTLNFNASRDQPVKSKQPASTKLSITFLPTLFISTRLKKS
jgi:hypothetical protein